MALSAIDTHLVVALHALLAERSVTRAARRVGVTQPSMSHALARLRDHFGDPLLVQVGRSMTLSERGKDLLPKAMDAVAQLERVFAPAEPFDPTRSERTFRLVASDNLELLVFPPLARSLGHAPRITVNCGNLPPDWAERLVRGELDGKLGRGGPVPEGCRSTLLARERVVCLMRRGHPAARRPLTVARYAELDHLTVAPRGDEPSFIDRQLAEKGLERRVALVVPHFLVAPHIVAESDLVATVAERVANAIARKLGLVSRPCPVVPGGYSLTFVWPARLDQDEGHRWLRQQLELAARPSMGLRD